MNDPFPFQALRRTASAPSLAAPEEAGSWADEPAAKPTQGWAFDQLRLSVVGFTAEEHDQLRQLAAESAGPGFQGPRLSLHGPEAAHWADLVLIDGADAQARAWSHKRSWLVHCVVVWVDSRTAHPGQSMMSRPLVWSALPETLAGVLQDHPRGCEGLMDPGPAGAATSRVMVISHDAAQRERLGHLLEQVGCRAMTAASAREGLAALHASRYDAVLLRAELPDVDGLEACRRMKRLQGRIGPVRVLLLSRTTGPWLQWRARWAGAAGRAAEPADAHALRAWLERTGVFSPTAGADAPCPRPGSPCPDRSSR